jgi:hypothetical protein
MGDMRGTRPTRRLLVIDGARKHGVLEEGLVLLRAIGRLRPWPRAGVLLADELRQPRSVMSIGRADCPSSEHLAQIGGVD